MKRTILQTLAPWACATALWSAACAPIEETPAARPELSRNIQGVSVGTGSMAVSRDSFRAVTLTNGKVLVMGGSGPSAELYEPSTGVFTPTGSMATGHGAHTATRLTDGRVLVVGGYGGSAASSVELYNPTTGTWSTAAPLNQQRYMHTATLLADGRVLVVGGSAGAPDYSLRDSCEIYDPATNLWSAAAPLLPGRRSHTATLLPDGRVLVAAGWTSSLSASAAIYTPATNTWTQVTPPPSGERYGHAAFVLPGGGVLIAGGERINSDYQSAKVSEVFNPATGTWTTVGSTAQVHQDHQGVSINGAPVLIGGYSFGSYIGHIERYDTATQTWVSQSPLLTPRGFYAAAVLANSSVLVAGGIGNNTGYLQSAELVTLNATTCTAQGATCGTLPDGLGGTLDCGTCATGSTCTNNVCVSPPLACSHSECTLGSPLPQGCSSCATTVCNADAYCCNNSWDSTCVTEAQQMCGSTCSGGGSCTPKTCASQGAACGGLSDGCGGTLNCGTCANGGTCTNNTCGPPPSTCSHSECATGGALSQGCSSCATTVCNADSYCCGAVWDGTCVSEATQLCGSTCSGGGSCTPKTCASQGAACGGISDGCGGTLNCGTCANGATCFNNACEPIPVCAHSECTPGGPLAKKCSACVTTVCNTDSFCCNNAWDAQCVSEAKQLCGKSCS
jgi:hypothetical protein